MGKNRATTHAFKMSITNTTIINRCPAISDDWYLDLKSFESITADEGLNDNILIDVLGQVVYIGAMITHDINGKICKRLEVVLRDTSDNWLSCTLWGRFADTMWAAFEQAEERMVTCLLRLAKINTFNGQRSISNAFDMSLLIINADYPVVQDFVSRLPKDEVRITVIQPKTVEPKTDKKVDYFNRFERKTISELLETSMEGKFKITAAIFNIDMDYGWYYFTCVKCDKTVMLVPKKENDPKTKIKKRLFRCKVCNENTTNVQPRYKLILSVMDHNAETKLMLFDNNAQLIVNQTVGEILAEPNDGEVMIDIPDEFLITDANDPIEVISREVYGDPKALKDEKDPKFYQERAILYTTNEDVGIINEYMLDQLEGEERIYLSSDSIDPSNLRSTTNPVLTPKFLNNIKVSRIPNHRIRLKVGCPIMLLRNIDARGGLMNGTRLQIKQMTEFVLEAIIITGDRVGDKVLILRILLTLSDTKLPFQMRRRQLPLAVAFAMTINKSQGQSLGNVGIYLSRPCFSHGQLYVAISRVTSKKGLKILIVDKDGKPQKRTMNVVFKEVFKNL
ncbi:PREDICTED: uncharacterized protein LOC104738054 [Camelina sativa]|uniref:Uncharacterized protein LOC104738054 n=1 Tax=Camelina sativa TaxID=90675 RepID=A0ABM0VIA1_CAMSA|nr:PREDICTED: uncharacterized protein LOC104738054 [Camelina sativa]